MDAAAEVIVPYTLSDRDTLRDVSRDVREILNSMSKRDEAVEQLEARVDKLERWQLKASTLYMAAGAVIGVVVKLLWR
jgi:hypothetical protein